MLNIVFLDAKTVGEVPNFGLLDKHGKLEIFETTSPEMVIERSKNKDVIITNKVIIDKEIMDRLPSLKLICVAATGTNNIDLEHAKKKGIQLKNVAGYSTDSVAQVTFAMLFHLISHLSYYDAYVKSGDYSRSDIFSHFGKPFRELKGKVMGIIGLGTIGKKVARIAQSFGMEVIFYSTSGRNNNIDYKRYDLNTMLSTSDVVSIHAPLTEQTKDLINYEKLKLMRSGSILLNTGRGGIINEADLARVLSENIIGAAGIDVYVKEPIHPDNPLLKIKDKEKLLLTPHIAWASNEARQRLIEALAKNIEEFSLSLKE
jgi:glycerate dehydrogenase